MRRLARLLRRLADLVHTAETEEHRVEFLTGEGVPQPDYLLPASETTAPWRYGTVVSWVSQPYEVTWAAADTIASFDSPDATFALYLYVGPYDAALLSDGPGGFAALSPFGDMSAFPGDPSDPQTAGSDDSGVAFLVMVSDPALGPSEQPPPDLSPDVRDYLGDIIVVDATFDFPPEDTTGDGAAGDMYVDVSASEVDGDDQGWTLYGPKTESGQWPLDMRGFNAAHPYQVNAQWTIRSEPLWLFGHTGEYGAVAVEGNPTGGLAPDNANIPDNTAVVWFDSATAAPKLMVTARDELGNLVAGEIPLV